MVHQFSIFWITLLNCGEFFSSGEATLYTNLSDQTLSLVILDTYNLIEKMILMLWDMHKKIPIALPNYYCIINTY